MSIAEAFLAEFEQELPTTRTFLERVPEDQFGRRPHPKSRSAGQLALHIAMVPGGVVELAAADRPTLPDFSQPDPEPKSRRELFDALDRSADTVRKTLTTFDDARMHATWTGVGPDGKPVMAIPRIVFLRSVLLNHWYHHRGQLGVYLRLLDVPVPASYGPSGDEQPNFAPPR